MAIDGEAEPNQDPESTSSGSEPGQKAAADGDPELDWIELTQYEDAGLETDAEAALNAPTRYAFMGRVGQGAMGEVLLAQDQHLRRKVAYKKILPQMARNRQVLSRFFIEAQITAQLDHPAIIPVYNLEVSPDGQIAYSMKLIQGRTYKQLLSEAKAQIEAEGKPDERHHPRTLLGHFIKVCDAMHFAHSKGVIHRDLKPANIMIGPYHEVYVMDWGIARIIGGHEESVDPEVVKLLQPDPDAPVLERTQLGQILGTPRYLSPEQATGKNDLLDGRSDLFTMGLILFETIALKPALKAGNQIDLLKKVLRAELEPLVHVDGKTRIAPELAAIVAKATARKREQRYTDVAALAADLRRYLRGEAVTARPDTPWRKLRRQMARHRQATLLALCALVLLSLLGAGGLLRLRSQAMLAAREHEQRLGPFLEQVADTSRRIDRQFFLAEMALGSLAAVTTEALVRGERSPRTVYLGQDYESAPPPDYALAPRYDKAISTGWPVFVLPPGLSRETALPRLQQLNRLNRDLGRLFLRGSLGASPVPGPDGVRRLIADTPQTPLRWVYVGLEDGIMFAYPGKGGYPAGYDPRRRPWYSRAIGTRGPTWQAPYLDVQGQGWLLPCTRTLYDYQDRFLGVAGVEIALKDIAAEMTLAASSGHAAGFDPRVKRVWLLDRDLKVVASQTPGQAPETAGATLGAFAYPEALDQLRSGSSGYLELGGSLLVYYRLDILGWIYVAEARRDLEPA